MIRSKRNWKMQARLRIDRLEDRLAPSFGAPTSYSFPGGDPYTLVAGEFVTGSGKLDVAVADLFGSQIWVLRGDGDGNFSSPVAYEASEATDGISSADFNGDGHLDIASSSAINTYVSVILGNGDGSFGPPIKTTVTQSLNETTPGDFNGDDRVDLAVGSFLGGTIHVLLGNGDGTFRTPVSYKAGTGTLGVTAGQFDADADIDLVATNRDSNNVSVFMNNGDGTFAAAVNFPSGGTFTLAPDAAGDLNGDQTLDLVMGSGNSARFSILFGNGDGTFRPPTVLRAGGLGPSRAALADFDQNGTLDIALPNQGSDSVSVLLGQGNGAFDRPRVFRAAGDNPIHMIARDFKADSYPELVLTSRNSEVMSVFLNQADWSGPIPSLPLVAIPPLPEKLDGASHAHASVPALHSSCNSLLEDASIMDFLHGLGVPPRNARLVALSGMGGWHLAGGSSAMDAMSNQWFEPLGLVNFSDGM